MPTPPSDRWRLRAAARSAVVAVVVGVALAVGGTAASAASPAPATPPALSGEAAQLQRAVNAQEAALGDAQGRLAALAAEASAALEAYQDAVRARDEALRVHREQVARWDAAQAQLSDSQEQMARWTSQAYRHGVAASGVAGFVAVTEARSPDDLQQRVTVLSQVGRAEARSLAGAAEAEQSQASATRAAEETAREALRTAADAAPAKAASDASVELARGQLLAMERLLASSRDASVTASAAGVALPPFAALRTGAAVQPLPGCSGSDLAGFGNGQVPASALCPLPGATGHALRSDAAAAFARLSAAYADAHGQELCVTDSYRDLEAQVALRAAKPDLAAVPGTSNHGWGVALDLCGGVEDFGTAQHAWMRVNAPLFGWFHPAWARQGGGKPEAWHWEFAG